MSDEEIFSEATEVYDNYVDALETGSIENLQTYARELSERIIPRGVETHEVLGIVLLLRDVLARSLFASTRRTCELLNRILDSYEPAANRIAVTVGVSFVEERERVINEQQEAMRELSTPVLQLRDRLLILPIIGVLDSARARQLTEQLLGAIRDNRATVVVIDITGVATIDRTVANHLVQTVEASRLMGARTILTGLSSEIAQTLVDLDVDLGMMKTVGDLQGGIEEAERLRRLPRADGRDSNGDVGAEPARRCRSRSSDRATTSSPRSSRTSPTARCWSSAMSSPSWSAGIAPRDRDRRRRARRDRLLRGTGPALDRPHRADARRRDGDHRHPAGCGDRDGAVSPQPGAAARGPRPGRGDSAARSPDSRGRSGWTDEVRVAITTDADLVTARAEGRAMAERLGFPDRIRP